MGNSKIIYAGVVLMDLTGDTVTPDKLLEGVTAHNAKGELITGTLKLGPTYKNLVPESTDTDGSIYNGTGYKDNARLSSSGGVSSSAQTGSVVTGFMPYKQPGVVRIKGATWKGISAGEGHYYINAYNASKAFLAGVAASDTLASTIALYDPETGVTTFDFSRASANNETRLTFSQASFIRINAKGKGADLIVTVDQEITG